MVDVYVGIKKDGSSVVGIQARDDIPTEKIIRIAASKIDRDQVEPSPLLKKGVVEYALNGTRRTNTYNYGLSSGIVMRTELTLSEPDMLVKTLCDMDPIIQKAFAKVRDRKRIAAIKKKLRSVYNVRFQEKGKKIRGKTSSDDESTDMLLDEASMWIEERSEEEDKGDHIVLYTEADYVHFEQARREVEEAQELSMARLILESSNSLQLSSEHKSYTQDEMAVFFIGQEEDMQLLDLPFPQAGCY